MVDFAHIVRGGVPDRAVVRNAGQTLTAIRAERLARRIEVVLASGSEVGHEFRGNQWTGQIKISDGNVGVDLTKFVPPLRRLLTAHDEHGKEIGRLELAKTGSYHSPHGDWFAEHVEVKTEHKRKGIATALYDHAERHLGKVIPSSSQTPVARKFWETRAARKLLASQMGGHSVVFAKDSNRTAKAVVRDEAGNVLLIKDATHGTWDLPGGHLLEGESFDQGLHREVKEETGLEIIGEAWRHTANGGRSEVFDAQVFGVKPRVTLSEEHTAFKWVGQKEAEELAAFWFQDQAANALGSSLHGFYPQTGPTGVPGHQNALNAKQRVRDEAEKEIAKAVARVVALAEAEVLAKKQDEDAFWTYAAAAFFGAIMAAYGQSAQELAVIEQGADHGEAVTEAEERAHAEQRAELLKDFPKRIRERLALEAKRGEELGETEAELHRRIGVEGDKILQGEGRVVAETEAQAIAGSATLRALKRAGFATAHWVSVGDDRVRETHIANEMQGEVKLGEKFSNGCRFPGDPKAPLSEIVNCRCWLVGGSRE